MRTVEYTVQPTGDVKCRLVVWDDDNGDDSRTGWVAGTFETISDAAACAETLGRGYGVAVKQIPTPQEHDVMGL